MRTTSRILCVLTAALLAGCAKAPGRVSREELSAAAQAPFSFTGSLAMEGLSAPVKLRAVKAAQGLSIELLEPEAVRGLTVEFGETTVKTTYRGLVMHLLPGDIPQGSVFTALRTVLAAAPGEDDELSREGGAVVMSGKAGLTPYRLYWSETGPALTGIELPSLGGVVTVTEFQKNQKIQ